MNKKRLADSISVAGRNAVVILGITSRGWSAPAAMVLYLFEGIFASALMMLVVLVRSPAREDIPRSKPRERSSILSTFLLIAGAFAFIESAFILFFTFKVFDGFQVFHEVRNGILGIFAFELLGVGPAFFGRTPLPLLDAENALSDTFGRFALLFLGIFVGGFLAAFARETWFVYPFVGLKAAVDIGSLFKREPAVAANAPTDAR